METKTLFNKPWLLTARGIFLIGISVMTFTVPHNGFPRSLVLLYGLLLILASFTGFWFASINKSSTIQQGWLRIESVIELIVGLIVLVLYFREGNLISSFYIVFAGWVLFLGIAQIFYALQLLQARLSSKVVIVVLRLLAGIACGIVAIFLVYYSFGSAERGSKFINWIGWAPLLTGVGLVVLSLNIKRQGSS